MENTECFFERMMDTNPHTEAALTLFPEGLIEQAQQLGSLENPTAEQEEELEQLRERPLCSRKRCQMTLGIMSSYVLASGNQPYIEQLKAQMPDGCMLGRLEPSWPFGSPMLPPDTEQKQ